LTDSIEQNDAGGPTEEELSRVKETFFSNSFTAQPRYVKVSADQGNAYGQCCYGSCLRDGRGVPIDFAGAAYYFKLSADQSLPIGLYHSALSFLIGAGTIQGICRALTYFKLSSNAGSVLTQSVVAWMSENGISTARDLAHSARLYEALSDLSPVSTACCGWCFLNGK
jgi:TPR repeat protein